MSHFLTIVILPYVKAPSKSEVQSTLEKLLHPFDENLEVPTWCAKCYCVGEEARAEVREQVNREFGTIDEARTKFHNDHAALYLEQEKLRKKFYDEKNKKLNKKELGNKLAELEDKTQEMWEENLKPRILREKELLEAHPKVNKPKTDCSNCSGTGEYETTSNFNAKWDWWRIGGRWDGEVTGEERDSKDNGFNFSQEHETLAHNLAPTDSLLKGEIIPFAIVTPDGEWHEEGEMGWWGIVTDKKEKKSWKDEAMGLYETWKGYLAIGCDCHI